MRPELRRSLAAGDLDLVMRALMLAGEITDADRETMRPVIQAWNDTQAVANLLIHPHLMPADLRLPALLRALAEPPAEEGAEPQDH